MLFRRGVTTGNRLLPAADFRFSRTERLRLEFPVDADVKPGTGRVLDRAGQPLQVPVTSASALTRPPGQRWMTADVSLAPLAGGDYAIESRGRRRGQFEQRILTGIRVTR